MTPGDALAWVIRFVVFCCTVSALIVVAATIRGYLRPPRVEVDCWAYTETKRCGCRHAGIDTDDLRYLLNVTPCPRHAAAVTS